MKTYKNWDASGLDLEQYLTEPCEIDEALLMYIGETVAPVYLGWGDGLVQGGNAIKSDCGIDYYMTTLSSKEGKHFYLGVLPEFR